MGSYHLKPMLFGISQLRIQSFITLKKESYRLKTLVRLKPIGDIGARFNLKGINRKDLIVQISGWNF